MKTEITISHLARRFLVAFLHIARLLLGFPTASVCLYEETCTVYAERLLWNARLYKAIPLIAWRVLSCNPIVALARKFRTNP